MVEVQLLESMTEDQKKLERKIDLSYAAAEKIGMINDGTARVRIEIIEENIEEKAFDISINQGIFTAGNNWA